jgi:hypothetical protein
MSLLAVITTWTFVAHFTLIQLIMMSKPEKTQNQSWFGLLCLTPLSTIFQLYRGCQFY